MSFLDHITWPRATIIDDYQAKRRLKSVGSPFAVLYTVFYNLKKEKALLSKQSKLPEGIEQNVQPGSASPHC